MNVFKKLVLSHKLKENQESVLTSAYEKMFKAYFHVVFDNNISNEDVEKQKLEFVKRKNELRELFKVAYEVNKDGFNNSLGTKTPGFENNFIGADDVPRHHVLNSRKITLSSFNLFDYSKPLLLEPKGGFYLDKMLDKDFIPERGVNEAFIKYTGRVGISPNPAWKSVGLGISQERLDEIAVHISQEKTFVQSILEKLDNKKETKLSSVPVL